MRPPRPARFFTLCIVFIVACITAPEDFDAGRMTSSAVFKKDLYIPEAADLLQDSILMYISGNDIVLDFNGLIIDGRSQYTSPDQFNGIALHITDGKNIEIRNLTVRGMRYAILAERVDSLKIINCDFSYNYRPRLHSKWDREAVSDWLYFHNNENDQWKRYAGAIYLKNCDNALITGVRAEQGFNALMMDKCNNSLIYNNNFRFNSGLGIGLYRSSNNRIMHNRIDFNVRGYSHGQYDRGQDSAGILLYEQCNENTIAFNSATHCGDGLFLWAGQQTMDSGQGGCNRNIIYKNDFSHSVANGVEATFSSNFIIDNTLNDCRYGIWGGYSHHTVIEKNEISECDHGIAIEHGNTNVIRNNAFSNTTSGIELWERASQPEDWRFADKRDVTSRGYVIGNNTFKGVEKAINLVSTDSVHLQKNTFIDVDDRIVLEGSPQPTQIAASSAMYAEIPLPQPLSDGMETQLESTFPRGRKNILVNAWGPYNFSYPDIFLRRVHSDEASSFDHTFALFGPTGNWKLLPGGRGIEGFRPKSGTTPSTIELKASPDSTLLKFDLEYLGPEYVDQFGDTIQKGSAPLITYARYSPPIDWDIAYFNYEDSNALKDPLRFTEQSIPAKITSGKQLTLVHRGAPFPGVNTDMFMTRAVGAGDFERGIYSITVESDDGVVLFIDGKKVIDNWHAHTAEIDETEIQLDGQHRFEMIHYDEHGLSVLDFHIRPKPSS